MSYVIGIDVGGTFTDIVCSDGEATWRAKAPTNPARFADGVLTGCELIAEQVGFSPSDLLVRTARFGLGTTAVTNVLATKRGRRVGVLTTAGFETSLDLARNRRESEDGWLVKPWNPVDLGWVRGVGERIDRNGVILSPLDPAEVRRAADELVSEQGVDAFAISFLWSFLNPVHEQRAAAVVRDAYPDVPVFCGSELHPTMREYERTTLAVLNAFTAAALDGVEELEKELAALGLACPMLVLQSSGGAITVTEARSAPIALASSGPAAGAVAAAEVAVKAGYPDVLCCDMGGTSVDVAVVRGGIAERRQRAEIHGIVTAQSAIDVESIGAGGGSIAWVDSRGLLRVGPQSARATPGPVCYGRGGVEPTVTDAMVLLGYIDPGAFMGGRMRLDVEAARAACARLGERLGLGPMEVAFGIREIALAEMSKAIRARIASGGIDVRKFGMVAFGGSGSLFAPPLAQQLGSPAVLTPAVASVLSAYGAATADIRCERLKPIDQLLPLDLAILRDGFAGLIAEVDDELERQSIRRQDRRFTCEIDVRFYRQNSEITLTVPPEAMESEAIISAFREAYGVKYGKNSLASGTPVQVGTIRVVGNGSSISASLPADRPASDGRQAPSSGARDVYLTRDQAVPVQVYQMDQIAPGHVVPGPALIDTRDTTIWVPEGAFLTVAPGQTLVTQFSNPAL